MSTISNFITRCREYIDQHDKLFGWIIAPLILFFLTTFVFNNIMKYFGKVEITNESFINVPKTVNGEELRNDNTNVLENYVQAKLVIENNKFESTIHKLILKNVTVEPYQYVDLVIQNGFNNDTQIVDFYRFNNGTQKSNAKEYKVDIKYHNSIDNSTSIIKSVSIDGKPLMGGDIESIFKIDLSDSKIKNHFDDTIPDYKQDIEITIHSNHEESKIVIPYLSSVGKFIRNLGSNGGPPDKPIVPVLELVEPYKQDYNFIIDQNLVEGKNYFKFNILVDKASLITYDIALIDDKGKTIVRMRRKDPIQIRFPQYKLSSPYKDDIYYYMKTNELNESNIDEVRFRQPTLVNSIDKTKKEYNLQK
ncbi:hypothetical protein MK367_04890 [Streptococcus sanguinis]|jgi:hypothetical protein|uniref:hypothetical protein n=1 Tax=Streptococcus sanguinis TaxID=1305 RepID=UPI002283A502|nr:hypothetical protein [Streptococcus sanguinis]MCY7025881.1 hypothetical protein [Streptococcus sanguinis]